MNTVTLIGTLTKDPEIRNGNGDAKVCSMRVAESNSRKGSPLFINIAAFGRQAETCGQYLVKGRQVAVTGQLRFREWEPEGGGKRSEHSIAADRVDFLPDAKRRGSGQGNGNGGSDDGGGEGDSTN
jgi:single-strand DNA-binding protein